MILNCAHTDYVTEQGLHIEHHFHLHLHTTKKTLDQVFIIIIYFLDMPHNESGSHIVNYILYHEMFIVRIYNQDILNVKYPSVQSGDM